MDMASAEGGFFGGRPRFFTTTSCCCCCPGMDDVDPQVASSTDSAPFAPIL
jgi:hypothetical protein